MHADLSCKLNGFALWSSYLVVLDAGKLMFNRPSETLFYNYHFLTIYLNFDSFNIAGC